MWALEVFSPLALGRALRDRNSIIRGSILFGLSLTTMIFTEAYYQFVKLEFDLTIPNLSEIYVPGTSLRDLVFGRVTYVVLTFLVLVLVQRLIVFFLEVKESKTSSLISAIMHSYVILAIFSLLLFPVALTSPNVTIQLVELEVEGLKMENVELSGTLIVNGTTINRSAIMMRADGLIAKMERSNSTGNGLDEHWKVELRGATIRVNDEIIKLGDVSVERLMWERLEVDTYKSYRFQPEVQPALIAYVASAIAWVILLAYVGLTMRGLYGFSLKVVFVSAGISYLTLLIFGLI
ncbi:MAG: hypothetical protein NZ920_04310 [Aigarchaeota archaeon]|nr:hypothetical protein [Aigarchaeota archaeon]MDW8092156.1 hypothetical protein [Nitrososphaerota archaeon]